MASETQHARAIESAALPERLEDPALKERSEAFLKAPVIEADAAEVVCALQGEFAIVKSNNSNSKTSTSKCPRYAGSPDATTCVIVLLHGINTHSGDNKAAAVAHVDSPESARSLLYQVLLPMVELLSASDGATLDNDGAVRDDNSKVNTAVRIDVSLVGAYNDTDLDPTSSGKSKHSLPTLCAILRALNGFTAAEISLNVACVWDANTAISCSEGCASVAPLNCYSLGPSTNLHKPIATDAALDIETGEVVRLHWYKDYAKYATGPSTSLVKIAADGANAIFPSTLGPDACLRGLRGYLGSNGEAATAHHPTVKGGLPSAAGVTLTSPLFSCWSTEKSCYDIWPMQVSLDEPERRNLLRYARYVLQLADGDEGEAILAMTSTSPAAEPPHFVAQVVARFAALTKLLRQK